MKQILRFSWLAPFILILASGIGRDDVPLEKYQAKALDPAYNCVGELYVKGSFASSCVLIDETHAITTAHSIRMDSRELVNDSIITPIGFRPIKRALYTYSAKPEQITIKINNKKIACRQFFIHPLYSDSFRSAEDYDLAIIELAAPVTGVQIPTLYPGEVSNRPGIAVGYGSVATADDYEEKKRHKRLKMAGENMIDSTTAIHLWADMDHPRLSGFNRIGSDKPLPLEWIGNGGDCGSPLFIEENNRLYLAGVSFSPATYSDMYYYGKLKGVSYGFLTGWTKVSADSGWIIAHSSLKK